MFFTVQSNLAVQMWSGGKKPNKYFPKEAKDRKPPPGLPTPAVTLMWLNETQQQQLSCQPQHTHSVKAQLCASTVHKKKKKSCSHWMGRCRPTSVFPSPHLPPHALFSSAVWAPAYIWKLLSDISDGQALPSMWSLCQHQTIARPHLMAFDSVLHGWWTTRNK